MYLDTSSKLLVVYSLKLCVDERKVVIKERSRLVKSFGVDNIEIKLSIKNLSLFDNVLYVDNVLLSVCEDGVRLSDSPVNQSSETLKKLASVCSLFVLGVLLPSFQSDRVAVATPVSLDTLYAVKSFSCSNWSNRSYILLPPIDCVLSCFF